MQRGATGSRAGVPEQAEVLADHRLHEVVDGPREVEDGGRAGLEQAEAWQTIGVVEDGARAVAEARDRGVLEDRPRCLWLVTTFNLVDTPTTNTIAAFLTAQPISLPLLRDPRTHGPGADEFLVRVAGSVYVR